MFIIQSGQAQVKGGPDGQTVFVTLGEGSVFGEIALLGVDGMNRRTADVVSVGFSNLFVLKKKDLEAVLLDYPDAKRLMNVRARKLMRENAAKLKREQEERENVIFNAADSSKKRDPALLKAVLEMMPRGSLTRSGLISRSASVSGETSSCSRNKAAPPLRATQSQDDGMMKGMRNEQARISSPTTDDDSSGHTENNQGEKTPPPPPKKGVGGE